MTTTAPRHEPGRTGWVPASSCGSDCLDHDDFMPCGPVRQALRLAGLLAVIVAAVAVLLLPQRVRWRWLRRLHAAALRALGVRLRVSGGGPWGDGSGAGVLVVANHLSWMDALALSAVAPLRVVAKREIRGWPVLGLLTARAGAVFVDRPRLRVLQDALVEITDALRGGDAVGVFPEGTTHCAAAIDVRFRRAPFQAAIDAGARVRPVAIAMRLPDGRRAPAAWVADGTWWHDVRRIVRIRGLRCELTVLPLLDEGGSRRDLARRAQHAIAEVLEISSAGALTSTGPRPVPGEGRGGAHVPA